MARPLKTLTPRIKAGVRRERRSDAPSASTHHQVADPRITPPTSTAGLAGPPPPLRPRVAARAAKEMIVAGLATVSPSVERYAQARPDPVAGASSGLFGRSNRIRSPSAINTAPPVRANGLRPLTTTLITAASPNAAIAA